MLRETIQCAALLCAMLGMIYCAPLNEPGIVEKSAGHNLSLSECRKWSEQYRDAGPDAEWSAYTKCADKADKR